MSKTVVTCVTTGYDLTKGKLKIDHYSFSLIPQIDPIANVFIAKGTIHSKKSVLKKGDLKVNSLVQKAASRYLHVRQTTVYADNLVLV